MKIEQLTTNCYRVRKTINKKTISLMFDHYPTDLDIAQKLAEEANEIDTKRIRQTFEVCANEYLTIKQNVLSPCTYRSYTGIAKHLPDNFKGKIITEIEDTDIQLVISNMVGKKSPKTILNYYGFISAVFKMFRKGYKIDVQLPQQIEYVPVTPLEEEIRAVLEYVKDTKYSIPFQMGVLGMRRSEICAALPSDIHGNSLFITRAKVESGNGFIIKEYTKTQKSRREVYLPPSLIQEINESGVVFEGFPSMLYQTLKSVQKKLGLSDFRFHDLRAFYASYAHSCGVPDAIIMANGGWATDYVMKKLYRRALQNDVEYFQEALASDLIK